MQPAPQRDKQRNLLQAPEAEHVWQLKHECLTAIVQQLDLLCRCCQEWYAVSLR